MEVRFVDTTFRDGSQSLWALSMRPGMMEVAAENMDRAGFDVIEVPGGNFMKKCVRDLKEDPWKMMRMLAKKMPNSVKSSMGGNYIMALDPLTPRSVIEFYYAHLVNIGALNRVQMTSNTFDQPKRAFPWIVPTMRKLGLKIVLCLSYTISPRHTDEYYAQKTREILAFKPDAIYLKDQGGLLTIDRARTLLPLMVSNANGVPVELHSHCTTGLAPIVYLEAIKSGVQRLHTGVPPLANGSAQPSIFNVANNARLMGYEPKVDLEVLRPVSERLTQIAKEEQLPIGAPLEYDYGQYVHQVPGGVISNLKHQLAELRILDRLDEVLEEIVQVRKDFGYPIMITPYSQFVVTQAAINVATGERYRHVIDDMILFAKGAYGEDSGYTWMDPNLRDRLVGMRRANELVAREQADVPLKEIREKLGGPGVSDDEFLLRYMMKGEEEIKAMRAAAPRQYFQSSMPLVSLLRRLDGHRRVRYVQVQRGGDSVTIGDGAAN